MKKSDEESNTPQRDAAELSPELLKAARKFVEAWLWDPRDFGPEMRTTSGMPFTGPYATDARTMCARFAAICMAQAAKEIAAQSESALLETNLLRKACAAAFAFIDSHVGDPDITAEMAIKHAEYIEARRALEGTP